ncbi:YheC/YheD family endospore coat-associated protein [Paenibacillus eucommiae]|uniref:YheC/YheD family protein n=1 Tax=Paenibacillus eucommiae TaxID=1355755 RepID=A0ABS4IQ80_9BACL|nr:YheC/YheD family protein [Paenibacillus eucommiae]MBP1989176.1 hypothetical protein [Paenibacillus eucommiae]
MFIKKMEHAGSDCFFVGEDFIRQFPKPPKRLKVHFGSWSKELRVVRNTSLPYDSARISAQALKGITLPHLNYKLIIDGHHVHIGPVLGLVGFKSGERITTSKLNQFHDYLREYDRIKGLVYVCGADGIHTKEKKISGYSYNPLGAAKSGQRWQFGTFPYPGVLYRRTALKPETYRAVSQALGRKLFNGYFKGEHFNKWDLWKWLSPHPAIRQHLPETKQLRNHADLDEMLKRYGTVYLKPTMDQMSRGIIKVTKSSGHYAFIFPENNKKQNAVTIKQMNSSTVVPFIHSLIRKQEYIVQQAITMKRYNQRGIDFRVIMQKNEQLQWSCTAVIARFGKKNSIVTNFTSSGYAMDGSLALQKAFHLGKSQSQTKLNQMIGVCTKACKVFEVRGGNYADLGVDVMVDPNGRIWMLEINILPDHKLALYAKKKPLYLKQVAKPLLYAKALAGFK